MVAPAFEACAIGVCRRDGQVVRIELKGPKGGARVLRLSLTLVNRLIPILQKASRQMSKPAGPFHAIQRFRSIKVGHANEDNLVVLDAGVEPLMGLAPALAREMAAQLIAHAAFIEKRGDPVKQ